MGSQRQLECKQRKVVRRGGMGERADSPRGCLAKIQSHIQVVSGDISGEVLKLQTKRGTYFSNYVHYSDYAISFRAIDLQ